MCLWRPATPAESKQLPNPQSHYPRGKLYHLPPLSFIDRDTSLPLSTTLSFFNRALDCLRRECGMVIDLVNRREIGRLLFCSSRANRSSIKRRTLGTFKYPFVSYLQRQSWFDYPLWTSLARLKFLGSEFVLTRGGTLDPTMSYVRTSFIFVRFTGKCNYDFLTIVNFQVSMAIR